MKTISMDELTIEHIKPFKEAYEKASGKTWWYEDTNEVYEEILRLVKHFGIQILQAYRLYDDIEESKIEVGGTAFDDYYLDYCREEGLLDDDE